MKTKPILTPQLGFVLSMVLISLLMTAVMTLGMALVNNPGDKLFIKHLWDGFLLGSLIAIPAGFIIVPAVQWLMKKLIKN